MSQNDKYQTTENDDIYNLSVTELKEVLLYKLVSVVLTLAPDQRDVKDLSDIIEAIGAKTP